MRTGARTPEELETLLEDAFVIRDRAAVSALFEPGAVIADGSGPDRRRRRDQRRAARFRRALALRDRPVHDPLGGTHP